ncbi:MAG TPA: SAM-dependent methyltransferase [Pseudonocardiaceae bacterium]|nr:SAM-dependent methyltransferase [Pseudonocardiaceae bacterium]
MTETDTDDTFDGSLRRSIDRPSEARVYDYYLGGACNFAIDREFGKAQIARYPDMPMIARENRGFLQRAVRHLVAAGVRQFVDVGSGLPTVGNVHQVADQVAPGRTRVVYVDHDPVAHSHAQLLLRKEGDPARHAALGADLLDTEALWDEVLGTGLILPGEPIGLLLVAMLHFVPDDRDPMRAVRWLRDQLVPGSYLVLSHATGEALPESARQAAERVRADYEEQATNPGVFRSRAEVAGFFGDWPLIEPGLVWTPQWPDPAAPGYTGDLARAFILAGVATKPSTP